MGKGNLLRVVRLPSRPVFHNTPRRWHTRSAAIISGTNGPSRFTLYLTLPYSNSESFKQVSSTIQVYFYFFSENISLSKLGLSTLCFKKWNPEIHLTHSIFIARLSRKSEKFEQVWNSEPWLGRHSILQHKFLLSVSLSEQVQSFGSERH